MKYAAILSAHAIDHIVSRFNAPGETVYCTCGCECIERPTRAEAKMAWAEHVSNEIERLRP